MMEFGACPRCRLTISESRRKATPVICNHCGHSSAAREARVRTDAEALTTKWFAAVSILVLLSYIQLLNWDKYALEIIPLKIKSLIGATSVVDSERLAKMCMELKKWDCVESNYAIVARSDSSQLARLGRFQMKRGKYQEAAQSFYAYFTRGGSNLDVSYRYAIALAQLGRVNEATKYFDRVLAARPDVLQITVAQNYVKLLMSHKRYEQAKRLIENIRHQAGPESNLFMESEYRKIRSLLTASRD